MIDENDNTDFNLMTMKNQARVLALKQNELDAYKQLSDPNVPKKEVEKYITGEADREAARIARQEHEAMRKEYPPHIKEPEYNEFWDEMKQNQGRKPPSRPSSAPRDSREQIDDGDTPKTRNRKKYSLLPNINKNTNLKKFDIDFSIIREDPLFGDYRKKNIKRRLMPLDGEKPFAFKEMAIANAAKRRGSAMDVYNAPDLPKELAPIEDVNPAEAAPVAEA